MWRRFDGGSDAHSIRLPNECATFEETGSLAERPARVWADHARLRSILTRINLGPPIAHAERAPDPAQVLYHGQPLPI